METDNMSLWVLVVDSGPASQAQLSVCEAQKPALGGVVDCSSEQAAADPRTKAVCAEMRQFPAFCHMPSNTCDYTLRDATLSNLPRLAPEHKQS